jgi:hypothetical protein
MAKLGLSLLLLIASSAAIAAPQVSLTSTVSVVRTKPGPSGKPLVTYEAPNLVTPGDRIAVTLDWANGSGKPADHFVVTNPVPAGLAFTGNASAGAQVSVDGGKTFGNLEALKATGADGQLRPAVPADVTHLRWSFDHAIGAGEHGQLKFEAIVK